MCSNYVLDSRGAVIPWEALAQDYGVSRWDSDNAAHKAIIDDLVKMVREGNRGGVVEISPVEYEQKKKELPWSPPSPIRSDLLRVMPTQFNLGRDAEVAAAKPAMQALPVSPKPSIAGDIIPVAPMNFRPATARLQPRNAPEGVMG